MKENELYMDPETGEIMSGLTGDPEKDGVLSPEQQAQLDRIQSEAAFALLNRLEQRQEDDLFPLAAMATGIGKTRIEHLVIEYWKRKNPDAKILFIAGTKLTLVDQSHTALTNYQEANKTNGNSQANYVESEELETASEDTEDIEEVLKEEQKDLPQYKVGKFRDRSADVRVATTQTITSRDKRDTLDPDEFDLVIVDEAHHAGAPELYSALRKFRNVVGFTATPVRSSGILRKPEDYGFEVVYRLPLPEAQNSRLLPPLLGMQLNTADLVDEIPTNKRGRIDLPKLEKILKASPLLRPFIADKVANRIRDGDKEYKTIIVVNFVWEAQELAQLLKDKGIKVGVAVNQQAARTIHSDEIPAFGSIERYKLLQSNPDSLQVLISPYVASEGFDAPFTEVLVWASPTSSDLRYTQYTGRLARRAPGKALGLVIDCLYQTDKYVWNYNFAMWMKGDVRQLPNGLFYLGPESDIASLLELDVVKSMRVVADKFDISDLQRESLEELKDTDLVTGVKSLQRFYHLHSETISPAFYKVINEHPEYLTKRVAPSKQSHRYINVVSLENRQLFLDEMAKNGVSLIEDVKDSDLPVNSFTRMFINGYAAKDESEEVIEELERQHPEYFTDRRSHSTYIKVITSPEGQKYYIEKMIAKGFKLSDPAIEHIKDGELPLQGRVSLYKIFVGDRPKIQNISEQVVEQLLITHPEYVSKRRVGNKYTQVITHEGKQVYIDMAIERGLRLRADIRETYLSLTSNNLKSLFIGDEREIFSVAKQTKKELATKHPDYFLPKGKTRLGVVTDSGKRAFIAAMTARGIKLRNPEETGSKN